MIKISDKTIKLWDLNKKKMIKSFNTFPEVACVVKITKYYIIAGFNNSEIKIYSIKDGENKLKYTFDKHCKIKN
jgi:WD40 repeat protein